MALNKQTVVIPLSAGLQSKADPRALEPPGLARCDNGIFDETGGIQTRRPYDLLLSITDGRRLARYNDERLVFAKEELYSYSTATGELVSRGTYLAPKVVERDAFINPSEQTSCDRVELGSVVMYVWQQASTSSVAMVAAKDVTTGAVILSPTSLGASTDQPRLVALTGSNVVLLFAKTGANALSVKKIDMTSATAATIAADVAAGWTAVDAANFGGTYYDVCANSTTTAFVAWTRSTTTSYGYASVTATPTVTANTKARDSVGAIGVAKATSAFVAVIRADSSTAVEADILTSAFVDSSVGVSFDTTAAVVRSVACEFRNTTDSGVYRCYAFMTSDNSDGYSVVRENWINTSGTAGTAAELLPRYHHCASRAFTHNGKVFFWAGFDGLSSGTVSQLQNTYFLYRDDGLLVAKAAPGVGGTSSLASPQLPGVQTLTGSESRYAVCGIVRKVVPVGTGYTGYADRGPRDIILTLDSDEARRCVQLGKTLYLAGGQIMQFDGSSLAELGFHVYPYVLTVSDGGAGNIADGSYTWWATVRSDNAAGERDRSTTATLVTASMGGGNSDAAIALQPVRPTLRSNVAAEVWRTAISPADGSPGYLVTSPDPTATGDNGYQSNNLTGTFITFNDNYADATLITKETYYETGGVLENLAPPPATIIAANADRLFLAGISYDPNVIWYSKLRAEGEVASFNDALTIPVPPTCGDITALAFLNETLIVFCERGVYALPGDGFDNVGGGQNYGPARLLSSDIGAVSAEAVGVTPSGVLFKSAKGWFQLDRGFGITYVGAPVADYDSDTISRVSVMEEQHQIRIASTSRVLLHDLVAKGPDGQGQWSVWSSSDLAPRDAALWDGDYYWCSATQLWKEVAFESTANESVYALDVTTAWITTAPYQRIYEISILGEYRSSHGLRIRLYRDYDDSTAFQDKEWTVSPTTVGGPEHVRHKPSIQKMTAIKIRITSCSPGVPSSPPAQEAVKLTSIQLLVGVKGGLQRFPLAQKQ